MKIGKSQTTDLVIVQGDITKSGMDAIVNAANSELGGGGGVDGAIHDAAGWEQLYDAAQAAKAEKGWSEVPRGESVITSAFKLRKHKKHPIKYIIHTVGPIQYYHKKNTLGLLENCFRTSLSLAEAQGDISSIAYPLIGTGAYGVPISTFAQAARNVLPGYDFHNVGKVAIYVFPGSRTQSEALPTLISILGM